MTDVLNKIYEKIEAGGRVSPDEGLMLLCEAPLARLGQLATLIRRRKNSDKVYYNRNFHIEPTNLCAFNCKFCSYRRPRGSSEMWDYSMEQIEQLVRDHSHNGATEVHIVGGVHPDHDIYYYADMIGRVKRIIPEASVKAFTAIELAYMIEKAGLSYAEGLELLHKAGMDAIPGGGAEIFDEKLRSQICPDKGSTQQWLDIHHTAHGMGIRTNATILYGHIETLQHRIDHLERLRSLQDQTGGFDAFIPLKYRAMGNNMSECGEVSVTEDMRMLALSRIYLDNFPHIKAYWVMYGKTTTEIALSFGADDIDGTIEDSTKIYSLAGAEEHNPRITLSEIELMTHSAGYKAVERDTFYNIIER